jgi:hypothetical protein
MTNSTIDGGAAWRRGVGRLGRVGALALAGGLALAAARGQNVLEVGMFTVGTSTTNSSSQPWAYLIWQGTTPEVLSGRTFAVYAKPGSAASTQPYQRKAIVSLTADPTLISSLLACASNLGEDPVKLEQDVTGLFGSLLSGGLSLPQKLSAVIQGATTDTSNYQNLMVLSRLHPGVSLCLGTAYAEPLTNSPTTYELRGFDLTRNQDLVVLGRVTVEAQRLVLPAPGVPVEVPDLSPKGHLNVKMRWATPDPLRRLTLLQLGYNVWRATKSFAEAHSWSNPAQPPAPAALYAATNQFPAEVKRCNDHPVLSSKLFSDLDVFNTQADPTVFFVDDDRRFFVSNYASATFTNGAQFYYFVTARDVLGRDGLASPGALVTLCDRLPPTAPDRVEVVNDIAYHGLPQAADPRLKVIWTQPTNAPGEVILGYYIYRWTNVAELHATELLQAGGHEELGAIAGLVPHVNGQARNSYLDNTDYVNANGVLIRAPAMPLDASKTFWYTIRTVRNTAGCGRICSPHSAPVYGVLRERKGPDAPLITATIFRSRPQAFWLQVVNEGSTTMPNVHRYRLWCAATNAGIAWAEFFRSNALLNPPLISIGRTNFPSSPGTVAVDYSEPAPCPGSNIFYCRVGLANGRASDRAASAPESTPPENNLIRHELFHACLGGGYSAPSGPSAVHESTFLAARTNPCVRVTLTVGDPRVREWRLYRRVDEGPITLIRQETNAPVASPIPMPVFEDCDLPVNAGQICYFGQAFDQHGNPSPLARINDCLNVSGSLPTPALFKLQPAGILILDQTMLVKWFCPPYGVNRFIVYINGELPANQPNNLSKVLDIDQISIYEGGSNFACTGYRTPRVGPGFSDGPDFQVTVNIKQGVTYRVFVLAEGVDGESRGPWSNIEKFKWSLPVVELLPSGPNVPWPALHLPPVGPWPANSNLASFGTIQAKQFFPANHCGIEGVGVRIGVGFMTNLYDEQIADIDSTGRRVPGLSTNVVPAKLVFLGEQGSSLLPVALYRLQVANALYPAVPGDVVQVCPLIDDIAYESVDPLPNRKVRTRVQDPFVTVCTESIWPPLCGLYLLDTQPLLRGARYRYFLVHFDGNHEIAQIIPTNDVEVTP